MPKKYQIAAIIITALVLGGGNTSLAQTDNEENEWQNWEMYVTAKPCPQYLNYPQSKLQPMTKVAITFLQPPHVPLSLYEDLYYTNNQPIGCKRMMNPVRIKPGTAGVIKITAVNSSEQIYPAANSALRVFVDLSLHSCMTKYLQVPLESFDGIVSALCNLGLHRHKQTGGENGIGLEIQSDRGDRALMLFD